MADPALWSLYRNTVIETEQNNEKSHITLAAWTIFEGIGDRFASLVCMELFERYQLPFAWTHTLLELFTSNYNWQRLSLVFDLPDRSHLLVSEADAFEVSSTYFSAS